MLSKFGPIMAEMKITSGLTLKGISEAAKATSFYVPELRIQLDCGFPFEKVPENIFITHGHSDHSGGIGKALIEAGEGLGKSGVYPTIYSPDGSLKTRIKNFIHSLFALSTNTDTPKIHSKYKLFGVQPGMQYPIMYDTKDPQRVTLMVEILRCYHTVPCVGYGFIEKRRKLRNEFKGLAQEELNAMSNGTILDPNGNKFELQEEIEFPNFCFMGDTTERALYTIENGQMICEPTIEKFPVVIIECSYIDDATVEDARKKKHMHWKNLEPYVSSHPNMKFVLIHFSSRYSEDTIRDFFKGVNLPNVIPFLHQSKNEHEAGSPSGSPTLVRSSRTRSQSISPCSSKNRSSSQSPQSSRSASRSTSHDNLSE